MTPNLPHGCSRCDSRWAGANTAHCPTCCATFSSPRSFDAHRIRRGPKEGTCADPATVGLVLADRVGYQVWGYPVDEAAAAHFARQKAVAE